MNETPMKSNRKDRRVQRTEQTLLQALLELIIEKGYERTTVQDTLDRASVGRATFYTHYFNKQDLLLRGMTLFQLDVDGSVSGDKAYIPDVTGLFEHIAAARPVIDGLRDSEALDAAWTIAREDLTTSFRELFKNRAVCDSDPAASSEFLANFFSGALVNLLIWWMDAGMPETPQTMNRWFARLSETLLTTSAKRC